MPVGPGGPAWHDHIWYFIHPAAPLRAQDGRAASAAEARGATRGVGRRRRRACRHPVVGCSPGGHGRACGAHSHTPQPLFCSLHPHSHSRARTRIGPPPRCFCRSLPHCGRPAGCVRASNAWLAFGSDSSGKAREGAASGPRRRVRCRACPFQHPSATQTCSHTRYYLFVHC